MITLQRMSHSPLYDIALIALLVFIALMTYSGYRPHHVLHIALMITLQRMSHSPLYDIALNALLVFIAFIMTLHSS